MPILWTEGEFPGQPEAGGPDPAVVGLALIEVITRAFALPPSPTVSGNGAYPVQIRQLPESRPHERQ